MNDDFDPARGMVHGVLLGLCCWLAVALLIMSSCARADFSMALGFEMAGELIRALQPPDEKENRYGTKNQI